MRKNIIIIILGIVALSSVGFIIYDKVLTKDTKKKDIVHVNTNDCPKCQECIKDSDDIKECICNCPNCSINDKQSSNSVHTTSWLEGRCSYEMIPYIESLLVYTTEYDNGKTYINLNDYNNKNEDLIKRFLIHYLQIAAIKNGFGYNDNGYNLTVDKYTIDSIVKTVFDINGLDDYTLTYRGSLGLSKINDNHYRLSWAATGGSRVQLFDTSFEYTNDNVFITSSARLGSDGGDHGVIGKTKITVNMDKSNNSCQIKKIEKIS